MQHVTFTGMLVGKDKLEAFTGSDVFVLPSYPENYGMAVIEAMACGLPVIIRNLVGINKQVEKAKAGMVISTDAKQYLLNAPGLNEEIRKNGIMLVRKKFTLDKTADEMIKSYEEIIEKIVDRVFVLYT